MPEIAPTVAAPAVAEDAVALPAAVPAWRLLVRHQLGAFVATVVDFAVMVALVEIAGAAPAAATAAGAATGAVVNFTLGRHWIFDAAGSAARAQALRYAFVSATSLLLQSTGEHVLVRYAGAHYVAARVALSIAVSLAWNFPMHRGFVFRRKA
jgi:putative flippase GtrA